MRDLKQNPIQTTIKLVKEALRGIHIPSPASGNKAVQTPLFDTTPSAYAQDYTGETYFTFVYGISTYGGEDVIIGEKPIRYPSRYFLEIPSDY